MAGDNSSSHAPRPAGWCTDSGHRDEEADAPGIAALEPDIRLTLPARPENVAVVRHALSALSEALDLPSAVTDAVRLAVTEACTNVVRHAYPDGEGTIDVAVRAQGGGLEVIVSDSGRGIGASTDASGPGLGLPLIAALSDSLRIERWAGPGCRLIMSFLRSPRAPAIGFA